MPTVRRLNFDDNLDHFLPDINEGVDQNVSQYQSEKSILDDESSWGDFFED